MNWIKDKIKKFGDSLKKYTRKRPSKNEQENADWINCPSCKKLQYKKDLESAYYICSCNYHFDYPAKLRLKDLFDAGSYENIPCPPADSDPLNFKVNDIPYISKRKKYEKSTGQDSAFACAFGKINGLTAVVVCSEWKFGGSAMTPKESEHFVSSAVKALEIKADIFVSILQSGGMAVTAGVPALASGMVKTQIAYSEMKSAGILTIGIACSKLSGGTYVMWNNHDILCVESPGSHDILFSGKRVTANLKSGEQLPEDFGQGSSLEALVDIIFSSRLEVKDGISKISRVLLKKPENKSIADRPVETIDESINETLSKTSKAI
tara:strand:+ start:762 stop:1727 length:966 start_codon:yes stop_codon:yes gene_type:complete